MTDPTTPTNPDAPPETMPRELGPAWRRLVDQHPWIPFVVPFAVFMLGSHLEPDPVASRWGYPLGYTFRIVATVAAVMLFLPTYRRIPLRMSLWALAAGGMGGVLWIAICRWGLEARLAEALGLGDWGSWGRRVGFNPFEALEDSPVGLGAFLAVRFLGLVLVVPLIEEFFLRGFLMRFFVRADWWTIPLGTVTVGMAGVATLYGVLSHAAEPLAAAVWFTWITLLYAHTRNLWDCVVAHAITNAMLGVYIVICSDWALW